MNIEIQSCGLVLLLIVLVITLRDKDLELSIRKTYRIAMLSCIAALVMDIISVIAITYASQGLFPRTATLIICKLYLVLLINVGYMGFLYAAYEFFNESRKNIVKYVYQALFVSGAVAILLLPIDYYANGRTVYSFGPSAMSAYAYAAILFASTIIIAYMDKEGTSRRRRRIILVWQLCWVGAAAIQFFKADILLVSFAAAGGIILIYTELENPNELLDRTTGQFNYNALHLYLVDVYSQNKNCSAMHIAVDYGAGELDLDLEMNALRRIANYLDEKDSYVFREADNDFVVVYKTEKDMEAAYEKAHKELETMVDLPISFSYTLIPDSSIFNNDDEFLKFQHYNIRNMSSEGTLVVGSEQAEEMRTHFRIRDQIVWALSNNGVEVYYQPIYNVKENDFSAVEALLRIRDSEGNISMPGRIIPIAEENGLIMPLGEEVFRQVCETLAKGELQKLGVKIIGVNLSVAQFTEDEPATFIKRTIQEYGVDPKLINFEITETADPTVRQNILKNMDKLIKEGLHFSLDDFGTGRSNLDYLIAMPVNVIKFDYEFTHWYFGSEKSRAMVLGMIDTIKKIGLPFVMEGVETKEQFDIMTSLGASYIQGFYFSKPLPKDEYIRFLENENK